MSDLQDALDWWDMGKFGGSGSYGKEKLATIVDAATKYANPDIEAASEAVSNEMANRRIDRYITDRDVWVEAAEALAVVAVDAALGVTENE